MEERYREHANSDAAQSIDEFIGHYYNGDFMPDFLQLTPQQRIGVFLKCVTLRLPRFKAIDLQTDSGLRFTDLCRIIGRLLRHSPDNMDTAGDTIPQQ